jgi:hypothetical protein
MKSRIVGARNFYHYKKLKALEKIKKANYYTTYFEGGLGSQILSFIEHKNRIDKLNSKCFTDTNYFNNNLVFDQEDGVTHWKWRLDHFGIMLEELKKFDSDCDKQISKLRRPNAIENSEFIVKNNLWTPNKSINTLLPIKSSKELRNKTFFAGNNVSDYGVVHIRKGDYLRVASKIIGIDDVQKILTSLLCRIPKNLIFISDGFFSTQEREKLNSICNKVNGIQIYFFDKTNSSSDETLEHDLMRRSKFLLASNSTFSFTAGLLNEEKDKLIVFPTSFYGEPFVKLNTQFQIHSKFCILDEL